MPVYRVILSPAADRLLRALDRETQERLRTRLDALAREPRPPGVQKLAGLDQYRIRHGAYRIIYTIEDAVLLVRVIRVGHRRDVYD